MSSEKQMRLTHRIERLERDARRWRLAAVVLGGVLGIVGLVGATTAGLVPVADEIRARRIVLVDEAGRERAKLDMDGFDATGRPGPRLDFFDEAARPNVRLSNRFGLVIADDMSDSRVDLTPNGLTLRAGGDTGGTVLFKAP